jgi:hypothetical protein
MQREDTRLDPAPFRRRVRRRASAHRAPVLHLPRVLDARVVAMALGILAVLGVLGATLGFVVDLFVAPWRIYSADVEESLHLLASLIGLAGAIQLWRHGLRPLVLAGLGLNVAATVVFSRSTLDRLETIVPLLTWLALAVLTVVARQPAGEPL